MTRMISWKKGMRLTDEILTASDESHRELVGRAMLLAAAGRFGLFSTVRPFRIAISINKNIVDVEALDCLAITRGGDLIDAAYDTGFTNSFDTRVAIPNTDEKVLYLVISVRRHEWRDTGDGYCEPVYSFGIVGDNTALADNAFPIARLVNEYGWHLDDLDFVPPCLYVASHRKLEQEYERFGDTLRAIEAGLAKSLASDCKVAIGIYWPIVQQLVISVDKDRDSMTPMMLLGLIQRCVAGFIAACSLDEHLRLGEPESFESYVRTPYSHKHVLVRIREGIDLCMSICTKVERFESFECVIPSQQPAPEPAPLPGRRGWSGREI